MSKRAYVQKDMPYLDRSLVEVWSNYREGDMSRGWDVVRRWSDGVAGQTLRVNPVNGRRQVRQL